MRKKLISAAPSWPFINAVQQQINLILSESHTVYVFSLHSIASFVLQR